MCLGRKKKVKSKVLSRGFCLRDSEAEQRALKFLHIYCSNANSYSSAPESNRQNPQDRTMDNAVIGLNNGSLRADFFSLLPSSQSLHAG